ncbi:cytochrome c biogenesis CcdA family protein [Lacibacterium aquatile]|uniref:Cytochrome c biogenesis CcdA family protein n=1 Tax=Lacibacterium aquatile TaxID=1168082 RepID=A0ABW5DSL6_9PROT
MISLTLIGLATAIFGGFASFLSPCVLPLVPGYIAYVCGSGDGPVPTKHRRLWLGGWFVLGFSTVFVLLGAGANLLSDLLLEYRWEAGIAGGVMMIVFGLLTLGTLTPAVLQRDWRWHGRLSGGTPIGAYLVGLAFAFGWTPCIGPILGAILTLTTGAPSLNGIILLAAYSVGLGIPFLLAAATYDGLQTRIGRWRRFAPAVKAVGGFGMIAMGLLLMTGRLTDLALWFLETFPWLATIG